MLSRLVHTAVALLLVVANDLDAQPTELALRDLAVGEVGYHTDTAAIRRALGAPDRISAGVWHWKGIEISVEDGKAHQIRLTSGGHVTRRGLRVGDSAARVRELYGESCVANELIFCVSIDPLVGFDERGIMIRLDALGNVERIFIGAVFSL